jgi:CheY-like chemotaxis protein
MHQHTILIADDDRLLRESLRDLLSGLGCNTHQACSGGSAIELLRSTPCDLLLSDIDMPDMSGFELMTWVHEHHMLMNNSPSADGSPLPVILMSARADDQLQRVAKRAGALTLLPKPVDIGRISLLVHQLFDH